MRQAREGPASRWVQMAGVRLELDRRILLGHEAPGIPAVPLLLDPESQAGAWWVESMALCRMAAGAPVLGAQGGMVGALPTEARRQLVRRFARLQGSPADFLPAPGRAVLLLEEDQPPLSAAPTAAGADPLATFQTETEQQIQRVLDRVSLVEAVQGILEPTPPVLIRRLGEELPLVVPGHVLEVGRRPRELESIVFGAAAIVLLFLAAGLLGVRPERVDRV